MALAMAALWLRLFFRGVYTDYPRYVLELDGFRVHIEAGCSGLESMGMVALLTLAYLAIFRRQLRFPHSLVLLPIGIGLAWLCNGVRLALMVWIGAHFGPELAIGGFHSKAGWVFFSAITIGLAFLGHHSSWFSKSNSGSDTQSAADSRLTTAFLLPMFVLLAVALLTGMLGHSEGVGYALRMALGVLTLALLWHAYGDLHWRAPGALLACSAGVALGVIWLVSGWPFPHEAPATGTGGVWLVVRAVGFSTVVPLVEELAFRGYLLRVVQNRRFEEVPYCSAPWWAVLVSSLVFGALHERWLAATVAGALYALLQIRSGQLRDAVLAHAATNATLAVVALAYQNPSFFG
jgi:exosortase E/protease (VPEID-CTERM system)